MPALIRPHRTNARFASTAHIGASRSPTRSARRARMRFGLPSTSVQRFTPSLTTRSCPCAGRALSRTGNRQRCSYRAACTGPWHGRQLIPSSAGTPGASVRRSRRQPSWARGPAQVPNNSRQSCSSRPRHEALTSAAPQAAGCRRSYSVRATAVRGSHGPCTALSDSIRKSTESDPPA